MNQTLRLLAVGFLLPLASCDIAQWEPNPQYTVVTDVHHTMELIIDPAAEIIWGSAGSIITADGEHDLTPSSAADWTEVEAAAAILAESGNLLMMPGRSAGADWNEFSSALTAAGQLATFAAQRQDADALFDAGGQIYQACLACHNQYLIEDGAKN